MLLVAVLLLGGCCSEAVWGKLPQPVDMFYFDRNEENDTRLRVIARELATKHAMRAEESERRTREQVDVDYLFDATRNSWLAYQCLAPADDAAFRLGYAWDRIDLSIVGPPDHPVIHALVADWVAAMDAAGIEYKRENRQPLQPVVER